MLYAVSFSNGIVGIFSSLEIIKKKVFDKYTHVTFVVQSYKKDTDSIFAWVVLYKDSENIAYVSNNKDNALKYKDTLNKIGKSYDDNIDYWEIEIDDVITTISSILEHLNSAYKDTSPNGIDSSDNII